MTKLQKYLIASSLVLLAMTILVKYMTLTEKATILVGFIEIAMTVSLGIGFGISTLRQSDNRKN